MISELIEQLGRAIGHAAVVNRHAFEGKDEIIENALSAVEEWRKERG
jgi:hypothetical protein